MTGKTGVWPVKSAIRPDIVRWPAVICSPASIHARRHKCRSLKILHSLMNVFFFPASVQSLQIINKSMSEALVYSHPTAFSHLSKTWLCLPPFSWFIAILQVHVHVSGHLTSTIDQTTNKHGGSSFRFPRCVIVSCSLRVVKSNMAATMWIRFVQKFFTCHSNNKIYSRFKVSKWSEFFKSTSCVLGHIKILMMHFLHYVSVKMHNFCVNAISMLLLLLYFFLLFPPH